LFPLSPIEVITEKELKKKNNMPISSTGKVSPYQMKKSPINMGTAAKPSPLKIWPVIIPLLAKGAAAIGAKVAAAGGIKAVGAAIASKAAGWGITKAAVGKAALGAGASIAAHKATKGEIENDPNDPFAGQKMGV
jgi:hypothetical protein